MQKKKMRIVKLLLKDCLFVIFDLVVNIWVGWQKMVKFKKLKEI